MKINSVAILGLGAVGSYVLWGLSEKPDIELSVIAKGDRKLRLIYHAIKTLEEKNDGKFDYDS